MKKRIVKGRIFPRCRLLLLLSISVLLAVATMSSQMVEIKLERSSNLWEWEAISITSDGLGEEGQILFPVGEDAIFFRLRIKTIEDDSGPTLEGMVRVAGGTLPALSYIGALDVDTFYIGKYKVTWAEWKEVRSWAEQNGYEWEGINLAHVEPSGCADDHPVYAVDWSDALRWCNARSEMEGLTPVYTVNGSVYRSGRRRGEEAEAVERNAGANRYRLPAEAEWELAGSHTTPKIPLY